MKMTGILSFKPDQADQLWSVRIPLNHPARDPSQGVIFLEVPITETLEWFLM
jgi:hypothetical protein